MAGGKTYKVALVGQPNVGKSSLFTRLTGVGVISSNYPGTTVEFDEGVVTRNGKTVSVHDLPGTYSLSGNSDDEKVVLRDLWEGRNDTVVLVADATNLVSSLVLCFETLELGLPTIIALTKMDEARKRNRIDIDVLSGILGVPVMPVSSKTSEGVDALADAVCEGKARAPVFRVEYMPDVEKAIVALEDGLPDNLKFNKRGVAVKLLEESEPFDEMIGTELRHTVAVMKKLYRDNTGQGLGVSIATSRYAKAESIVSDVVSESDTKPSLADRISDVMITPITGIPILLAVCLAILTTIVYVGSFLDEVVSSVYGTVVGTAIIDLGGDSEFWTAVLTGIDGSIQAIMSLVIPYIMVFYIILGILEDSGYLTRAVVLLDKTMHHFGLHGGSFIPIIVGLGCNVPAIMAVRTVQSRREKIILSSMIVMAVPCSAQMAIIMGATGQYSGIVYAFGILVMLVCLAVVTGVLMNKFMKYEPSSLAMELPDLQVPSAKNVLFKTWYRIKDFFYIAFPLLVVGSIVVEVMLQYELLDVVVEPLSFITVDMLGLPAVCIIAFIVGILRKEMALGMLAILFGSTALELFMTPDQFVVFGVVMAVYMPCVATLITMWREIGWKETVGVSVLSIVVAILLGTVTNLLLQVF